MKRSNVNNPVKCGVCGRWRTGEWLPSGQRNPRTGEAPHDNFVCHPCAQEGRDLREVERGLDPLPAPAQSCLAFEGRIGSVPPERPAASDLFN